MPCIRQKRWTCALASFLLVGVAAPALRADPRPLPAATQKRVNQAIDRGVAFLHASQGPAGTWATENNHVAACAALPGLTLLECGASALEPSVVKAAELVRRYGPTLDTTYELALSILFLDRLGDRRDRPLIQTLALRLIAGQTATGGWGYKCPLLGRGDQQNLLAVLRKLDDRPHFDPALLAGGPTDAPGLQGATGDKAGKPAFIAPSDSPGSSSSSSQRSPPVFPAVGPERMPAAPLGLSRFGWCIKMREGGGGGQMPDNGKGGQDGAGDVKPKPVVAVFIPPRLRRLPVLLDPKKLVLVDPADKGQLPVNGTTDNSNTQFATLALWAARRHGMPMKRSLNLLVHRFRTSQNGNGSWGYAYTKGGGAAENPAMTCVGLLGLAVGHGVAYDKQEDTASAARRKRDPLLVNGLAALGKHIGVPAGRLENLPQPNLYMLWSIERVGVLYDLPTLGGKEWYRWAAECLVANQQVHGNWTTGGYPGAAPVLDTCLALLVLKRANLASDLTDQLKLGPDELAGRVEDKQKPAPSSPEPVKPTAPAPRDLGKSGQEKSGVKASQVGLIGSGSPSLQLPTAPTPTAPSTISSISESESTRSSSKAEESAGGGKKLWVILLGVAGLVVMGAAIVLLMMNRNQQKAAVAAAAPRKKRPRGVSQAR